MLDLSTRLYSGGMEEGLNGNGGRTQMTISLSAIHIGYFGRTPFGQFKCAECVDYGHGTGVVDIQKGKGTGL